MKIAIDPGHGMSNRKMGLYDPVAVHIENGFEFHEAAIALRYGVALKEALLARGIDVFMTRDDKYDHTPLTGRASMAQKAGCDLFISLHLNDFETDVANGTEIYFRTESSKQLANKLQSKLVSITGLRDRGIQQKSDLAVLKFDGPAVLVELGFIANDNDRNKLIDAQVRHAIVQGMADVIIDI